ncbi:(2E,6E)-farnesyl diphosphate synthase [Pokkaliibacter sp. CJK22405]|uniref:(2E,6E)-farnesyl diphosphate synthase n=1 Tax=Pokkaliibacter sp. CJK22405 TaxID=3384615 RepID=UPI003984D51F
MATLPPLFSHWQGRADQCLRQHVTSTAGAESLKEAIEYSLFNGGKRVRPALAYATAHALGLPEEHIDRYAAALECIHAYSLVHDDLPAMDDDDLRRGKPTCHIAFDEATAILAGDALNTLAFGLIADDHSLSADVRIKLISHLSLAAGMNGMVAGQVMDMAATGKKISLEALERLHRHKTGALLKAAVIGSAIAAEASKEQLKALTVYAEAIGLAFQVQDDILDIESSTEVLGKQQGADLAQDKSTYPALLGLSEAKNYARQLTDEALEALTLFGAESEPLAALARYITARVN